MWPGAPPGLPAPAATATPQKRIPTLAAAAAPAAAPAAPPPAAPLPRMCPSKQLHPRPLPCPRHSHPHPHPRCYPPRGVQHRPRPARRPPLPHAAVQRPLQCADGHPDHMPTYSVSCPTAACRQTLPARQQPAARGAPGLAPPGPVPSPQGPAPPPRMPARLMPTTPP